MAKPSQLPAWNTGGANRVDPTAPEKVLGWTLNQKPASSTFNWWQNLVYQWTAYVNGGTFDAPITVAWPGAPGLGPVLATVGDFFADGESKASGNVVAEADLKFETIRSRRIPGVSARSVPLSAHTLTSAGHIVQTNDAVVYPLVVEVGDRIDGWLVWITKTSNAAQTLQARLGYVLESSGAATYVGSPATVTNNANNPGRTGLVKAGLAHDVVGDASYFIECSAFNGGGVAAGADSFLGAELNYTRPS